MLSSGGPLGDEMFVRLLRQHIAIDTKTISKSPGRHLATAECLHELLEATGLGRGLSVRLDRYLGRRFLLGDPRLLGQVLRAVLELGLG